MGGTWRNKITNNIRTDWRNNKKIDIITEGIRESIKIGDSRMVWRRINHLKIIKISAQWDYFKQKW